MSKLKEVIERMKSPPPERLAKIEYQSHFLNIVGVLIVSVFLIYTGYWFIIFAFIFSIGVSYSQGMAAYAKYKIINNLVNGESHINIEEEKSPTRKRTKIIQSVMGKRIGWLAAMLSVVSASLIINPLHAHWYQQIALLFLIIFFYILFFFFIFYYISIPFYRTRMKGGNNNAENKN